MHHLLSLLLILAFAFPVKVGAIAFSAQRAETIAETSRIHGMDPGKLYAYAKIDGIREMQNPTNGGSIALNLLDPWSDLGFASGEVLTRSYFHGQGHNMNPEGGEAYADYLGEYGVGAQAFASFLHGRDWVDSNVSAVDWLNAYGDSEYIRNSNALAGEMRKDKDTQFDSLTDHAKRSFNNDLANFFGVISDEKAAENQRVNDAKLNVKAEKIAALAENVKGMAALVKDPELQRYILEHPDEVVAAMLIAEKKDFDQLLEDMGSSDPVVAARAKARLDERVQRLENEGLLMVLTAGESGSLSLLLRGAELAKTLKFTKTAKAADNVGDIAKAAGKVDVAGAIKTPSLNISAKIHDGAQGKHIEGHNNFDALRSPLEPSISAQELLDQFHAGKATVVGEGSRGSPVVDFGRVIGTDKVTGLPTTLGQIHSGSKGAHIVPENPLKHGGK